MTDSIVQTSPIAEDARVVFEDLAAEYTRRYSGYGRNSGAQDEMLRYPPEAFAPPLGTFLVLRRDGQTIAAGAFMSHDDETVEMKRVWSHADHRRQGLARRIMLALEQRAADLGYTRAYLTTGHLQPEAVGLYLSLGYRPLFDRTVDPERYRSLPFEKAIGGATLRETPIRQPSANADEAAVVVAAIKAEQADRVLARIAAHRASVPA